MSKTGISCHCNQSLNQEGCSYFSGTTWADSMYNGLIFLRKNWQMFFHLLSVQFCNYAVLCHTKIFYSDWVVFTYNFIHEVVIVMVVMAVDCAIPCGTCTNTKILFFSCNKYNVITCHMLFILDCRWSHSHYDRCSPINNQYLQSVLHGKNGTESLI